MSEKVSKMKVVSVDLKDIVQTENSRAIYKAGDLSDLMHSMKKDGLLQPIGLRPIARGKYEKKLPIETKDELNS